MNLYACMECGRKFRTVQSARAAQNNGCPGCGGTDVDLAGAAPTPPLVRPTTEPETPRAAPVAARPPLPNLVEHCHKVSPDTGGPKPPSVGVPAKTVPDEMEEGARRSLTLENLSPDWATEGGSHWVLTAPCGAYVSALRTSDRQAWMVYDCEATPTRYNKSVNEANILKLLRAMLRAALVDSLAAMDDAAR